MKEEHERLLEEAQDLWGRVTNGETTLEYIKRIEEIIKVTGGRYTILGEGIDEAAFTKMAKEAHIAEGRQSWRDERKEVLEAEGSEEKSAQLRNKRVHHLLELTEGYNKSSRKEDIEAVFRDLAIAIDSVVNKQQNRYTDLAIRALLGQKDLVGSIKLPPNAEEELSQLGMDPTNAQNMIHKFCSALAKGTGRPLKKTVDSFLVRNEVYKVSPNKEGINAFFHRLGSEVIENALSPHPESPFPEPTPENANVIPNAEKALGRLGITAGTERTIERFIGNYRSIVANKLVTKDGLVSYTRYASNVSDVSEGKTLATHGGTPDRNLSTPPTGFQSLITGQARKTDVIPRLYFNTRGQAV